MRVARWLSLGCVTLGLALACAGSKPPPPVIETQEADLDAPPSTAKDTEKDTAEQGDLTSLDAGTNPVAVSGNSTPTVTLLEPGAEPRKELRHTFVNGARQKLKMNAKTAIAGMAGMPTISLSGPMDTQIVEVKSGNAKFKIAGGPFKTSTSGGSDMAGAMGGLLGGAGPQKFSGWGVISPVGVVTEFHLQEGGKMGENAPVETGDPFPEEAVGAGARWEVKQTLQEKDGPVEQVSTYTLLKADKKQVQTEVSRVQTPLNPDAAGGTAESSGQLTFTLGSVYPTGKLTMTRKLSVDLPGLDAAGIQLSSDVTIAKR